MGVDKETHVNLRQVPEDLLPALETHLSEMDTTKKSSGSQPRFFSTLPPSLPPSTEKGIEICKH